ncbi:excalibur calcium-binding domain-containing protein [Rodentibacter ratti]|uniref:Cold-shock protein n=1 Tax=Rodentibacter ratti TaxID=1906745 RepID=A0A1V3L5P9_9PAST|nr:excalibur calcium-binding domain-containing protein [Rodentibacter ratti]OOF85175.1 cold-shock protein [Rodentibacter ratti]
MKKLTLILSAFFLISSPVLAKGKKAGSEQFSCEDSIPYCKQMKSCAQAKFYLKQCGVDRLDRDGDGVPCENVCKK